MRLFEGFESAHGTHGQPDFDPAKQKWHIKNTAKTLREPVTLEMWEQHLAGKRALGIIPVREDSTCSWGSIDIDKYDINLLEVVEKVERAKLPLLPCRSKSGGLHLFMFTKEPQPAIEMLAVLRAMAAALGFATSEVFPVQTKILTERGDLGNWMVMPYFGSNYGGKIRDQFGLKKTGGEMTVGEFLNAAEEIRVTSATFGKLSRRDPQTDVVTAAKGGKGRKVLVTSGADFSDGPPCLQHMASQGVPPGGQNNTLMMFGIYYKRADPNNWKKRLEEANAKLLDPPGSMEGLQSCIRSLEKKEYNYTCKKQPMVEYCSSALCRTRPFGVGDGEGSYPQITSIAMLDVEPPIWFVTLADSETRIELSTEQLQQYTLFHRVVMAKTQKSYLPVKNQTWFQMLDEALQKSEVLEAPKESRITGKFLELMSDFLTNRQRGKNKEDILLGKPWFDEEHGRHYFRLKDVERFLDREKVRDYTRSQISKMLTRDPKIAGGHCFLNITSGDRPKGVNVYWLSKETIEEAQEVEPPKMEKGPI